MEEKILFKNKWLSLREKDGYTFVHEERCPTGAIVAILVYTLNGYHLGKVYGRYETCPCHNDGIALTSITGGVESNDTPLQAAVKELKEEAGYVATPEELEFLGTVRPSKASDSLCYLYAYSAEGKGANKIEPTGDGSEGEKNAYCKWVSYEEAIDCKCPLMSCMLLRLVMKREMK